MSNLNISNSIFPGLNDKGGLMLCGYEWGFSKADQSSEEADLPAMDIPHVFSNKAIAYGERANKWRYDQTIIRWFEIFGHPLSRNGTGGDFEKCIVQTNWCNTKNYRVEGSYAKKLLQREQIDNFLLHVGTLEPQLILFFGSQLLTILQDNRVQEPFTKLVGRVTGEYAQVVKPFPGRRFRVGFQEFERCSVICLPHPSGSHGVKDEYIKLFSEEVSNAITKFKRAKKIM